MVAKSFAVANGAVVDPATEVLEKSGSGGTLGSTAGGNFESGSAIPKSGLETASADSFVVPSRGKAGTALAGAGDGEGDANGGGEAGKGVAVKSPGLEVVFEGGFEFKMGFVGKVANPDEASGEFNGLSAGLAFGSEGLAAPKPALGVVLKAAQGSVDVLVADGAVLLAVKGPVTPEMSGVVVSRSTRFSSSGFSVVFVPLSATKPP